MPPGKNTRPGEREVAVPLAEAGDRRGLDGRGFLRFGAHGRVSVHRYLQECRGLVLLKKWRCGANRGAKRLRFVKMKQSVRQTPAAVLRGG